MKILGLGIVLVLMTLLAIRGLVKLPKSSETPSPTPPASTTVPVPFTASFSIYTLGTQRIFTDSKYHNRSPKVYIEASNPSLVHITQPDLTWQVFFDTLPSPMKVANNCLTTGTGQEFCTTSQNQLEFSLNGKLEPDVLNQLIQPGDQLIITYD